jgi:hypothetical protein
MQTEISWFFMKSPELAGIRARTLSLQAVDWISAVVLGPLSLPAKSRFPTARLAEPCRNSAAAAMASRKVSGSLGFSPRIALTGPGGAQRADATLHAISI